MTQNFPSSSVQKFEIRSSSFLFVCFGWCSRKSEKLPVRINICKICLKHRLCKRSFMLYRRAIKLQYFVGMLIVLPCIVIACRDVLLKISIDVLLYYNIILTCYCIVISYWCVNIPKTLCYLHLNLLFVGNCFANLNEFHDPALLTHVSRLFLLHHVTKQCLLFLSILQNFVKYLCCTIW